MMFCTKCGTKALDGATFCQKCGAQLITTDTAQQAAASTPARQMQPQTQNVSSDSSRKKKSKKLPIIIGVVALVFAAVIVIAMNWNGEIDYEATVRAHQPFAVTEGLSSTYGDIFDKYISSPVWEVRKSGDVNYVDISGKAKGTDNELLVTIKVTPDAKDSDIVSIVPESVTVDNEKSPTQNDAVEFLWGMFLVYDQGDNDLSYLMADDTENRILYQGVPVDQLLGASPDDFTSTFGEPDIENYGGEELIYGDVTITVDMWSAAAPYLSGIYSNTLDDFTYNGQPLSDNYDELTQILGREPNEARVDYDTYYMTYNWKHMDSFAYLTVETPAAEGSQAITQIGVSWWVDTSGENNPADNEEYQVSVNYIDGDFEWVEQPAAKENYVGGGWIEGTYIQPIKMGDMIQGSVRNTTNKTYSYVQINFTLYDSSGNQVGSTFANINNLGGGNTWKFEATVLESNVSRFEFTGITAW